MRKTVTLTELGIHDSDKVDQRQELQAAIDQTIRNDDILDWQGKRVLCKGSINLGNVAKDQPVRYDWTGGAELRFDIADEGWEANYDRVKASNGSDHICRYNDQPYVTALDTMNTRGNRISGPKFLIRSTAPNASINSAGRAMIPDHLMAFCPVKDGKGEGDHTHMEHVEFQKVGVGLGSNKSEGGGTLTVPWTGSRFDQLVFRMCGHPILSMAKKRDFDDVRIGLLETFRCYRDLRVDQATITVGRWFHKGFRELANEDDREKAPDANGKLKNVHLTVAYDPQSTDPDNGRIGVFDKEIVGGFQPGQVIGNNTQGGVNRLGNNWGWHSQILDVIDPLTVRFRDAVSEQIDNRQIYMGIAPAAVVSAGGLIITDHVFMEGNATGIVARDNCLVQIASTQTNHRGLKGSSIVIQGGEQSTVIMETGTKTNDVPVYLTNLLHQVTRSGGQGIVDASCHRAEVGCVGSWAANEEAKNYLPFTPIENRDDGIEETIYADDTFKMIGGAVQPWDVNAPQESYLVFNAPGPYRLKSLPGTQIL